MSDTVVVCLSCLIGLGMILGTFLYLSKRAIAREDERDVEVADLTEELTEALVRVETLNETPKALLALSERVSIFESALKAVIAQMTNITQYEEAKYQELLAKTVTSGRGAARPAHTVKV